MEDIFEIKFPIESEIKDTVITKFATKQGGAFAIFSYYWQCFVWAAAIGFLRNEKRPLSRPTERIFTLNTMRNNGGEKDAQALICMCVARFGSLEIMKHPEAAITFISEYANGGFYHIMNLMKNGENSFNDFEKVKQEIFSRNYAFDGSINSSSFTDSALEDDFDEDLVSNNEVLETNNFINVDIVKPVEKPAEKKTHRWSIKQEKDLIGYYSYGMTIQQLSTLFNVTEEEISQKLVEKGLL